MSPKLKCPNCGERRWRKGPHRNVLPSIAKKKEGKHAMSRIKGAYVRAWICGNCKFIILFWERGSPKI